MNEELEILKLVADRLKSAGIEYMMTGSMAMALYSMPRMTRDIDMILNISSSEANTIFNLFNKDFYIDKKGIDQAIQNKGIFNIIHNETIMKIDFIVRKDEEFRREEFARRRIADIAGTQVYVVTAEDLILSKLVWVKNSNSELQYRDVQQMIIASKSLDHDYIEKWAVKLAVGDLLKKALKCE